MPYEVELRTLEPQVVASIIIPGIKTPAVGAAFGGALPDVYSYISSAGVPIVGPPFARYHGGARDSIDLEVGVAVGGAFTETSTVRRRELPGGDAISTVHVGSHGRLREALLALAEWRVANGRVAAGPFWEVYTDDPSSVPADEVRTELIEPLAAEGEKTSTR